VSKVRLAVVLALVSASATLGLAATGLSPAAADVTATSGRAFGASASVAGIPLVPPTPLVQGGPAIGYPLNTQTALPIGVPLPAVCPVTTANVPFGNIVEVCAITASTQGIANANPHLNAATSTVEIAGAAVGSGPAPLLGVPDPLLTVGAVTATCRADGDVAVGQTTIADLSLGGDPVATVGPIAPNTTLGIPGVLEVFLNEQIPAVDPNTVGINTITVNALRIVVLGTNAEIILGHVECTATGPDVNNIGDILINKVSPGDAQNVPFTFTVTCTGFGNAPFIRTFNATVTGSGSTTVNDIQGGTVCTVAETPTAGFVNQLSQTVTVVRDAIQTVNFINARVVPPPGPTGSVQVVKVAPADAQSVVFTFIVTCPGAADSPFVRTVTGSNATFPVSNLAVGTVCTASETPTDGFVDQADRTFPAVIADATQSVTFVNTRVGTVPPPGPPNRPPILPRTGANILSLVTLAGSALFLGSLLTLVARSPGMLSGMARNVAEAVRLRQIPSLSSARSSLLRALKRRNGA